jgi:hypothetical protein
MPLDGHRIVRAFETTRRRYGSWKLDDSGWLQQFL